MTFIFLKGIYCIKYYKILNVLDASSVPSLVSPLKPVPVEWEGLRLASRGKPISCPWAVLETRGSSWVSNHREPSNREESKNWKWNFKKACCEDSCWVPPFLGKWHVSTSREARGTGASSKHRQLVIHPALLKSVALPQRYRSTSRYRSELKGYRTSLEKRHLNSFICIRHHFCLITLECKNNKTKEKKQQRGFVYYLLTKRKAKYSLSFTNRLRRIAMSVWKHLTSEVSDTIGIIW